MDTNKIAEVIRLWNDGEKQSIIARLLGISQSAVSQILNRKICASQTEQMEIKPKRSKVSKATAHEIRRLYAEDELTQTQIAERFGLSQSMIGRIVNYNLVDLRFRGGALYKPNPPQSLS